MYLKNIRKILGIVFVIILANTITLLSFQRHNGINSRVSALLIAAMKSRDAGKMERANFFWNQAKSIRPSIAKPNWLSVSPTPTASTKMSKQKSLSVIASLPYSLAKPVLNNMLSKHPENKHLRRILANKAKEANDIQQVIRNQSLLKKVKKQQHTATSIYWKIIFILLIILLVIWQGYKVISEVLNKTS